MFTGAGNNIHRNAAISTDQTDAGRGENRVNFADRVVLFPKTEIWGNDWVIKPTGGQSRDDDC